MLIITTILLSAIFRLSSGMMYSVFIIDLIMSICYIIWIKDISSYLKGSIAATKLLGDVFAGLLCAGTSKLILIIVILVFLCILFYLCYCLEEKNFTSKKGKGKKTATKI